MSACMRMVVMIVLMAPASAWAHALGGRYDLPLPLGFYLTGSALAVALSFVGVAALLRPSATPSRSGWRCDLTAYRPIRFLVSPPAANLAGALGLAMLGLMLVAAYVGSSRPAENPAVTIAWILFWVGGAYLSVATGDGWWRALDPWRFGFRLWQRLAARRGVTAHRGNPAQEFGRWPAAVLLAAVFWLELVYPDAAKPATLGTLIVAYSLLAWATMARYGPDEWRRRCDPFAALFGELARLAPLALRSRGSRMRPSLTLRPPGQGITEGPPASPSTTAIILVLLAAVSFDGLTATPQWAAAWRALADVDSVSAALRGAEILGLSGYAIVSTVAFAVALAAFAGAYIAACAGAAAIARAVSRDDSVTTARLVAVFAPTLLPIGAAYHLAHYFSYLLIQGQRILPQLSDPLGRGQDWVGMADHGIAIDIVSPATVWYVAVGAIVGGHVAAVYAAHRQALRRLDGLRTVALSQLPLVTLMIGYTVFSLWLFAQPTVEAG